MAADNGKPVRIGVNAGSLNQELVTAKMAENTDRNLGRTSEEIIDECMVLSALQSTELALASGLRPEQIVISCKLSQPSELIAVYRQLAARTDQPLHLGLTEAGMGIKGLVWSAAAIGILLHEGIGDTIRVSLTPRPGGDRRDEVYAACELLQSLGLRSFAPSVTSCPGCGRTTSTTFQALAERIQSYVREKMPDWKREHAGVETMRLAVMGCVVNGPGESRAANIGISLPGTGEAPACPVFIDGQKFTTLKGNYDELATAFRAPGRRLRRDEVPEVRQPRRGAEDRVGWDGFPPGRRLAKVPPVFRRPKRRLPFEAEDSMVHLAVLAAVAFASPLAAVRPVAFDEVFEDATARIDTYHIGNSTEEIVTLDRIVLQGSWAGSRTHLTDPFGVGRYLATVTDPLTGVVLFSKAYDTYFGEYRTTAAAGAGMRRTFHESVLIPCPKKAVRFTIGVRQRDGSLRELFATEIDPASTSVVRAPLDAGIKVIPVLHSGDPHGRVDVAIIAEGYTAAQERKFRADLARFVEDLLRPGAVCESQGSLQHDRGIQTVPGQRVLRARLGRAPQHRGRGDVRLARLRALPAHRGEPPPARHRRVRALRRALHHGELVQVRRRRDLQPLLHVHGRQPMVPYVFLHEFGHHFAGLADEYYTSSVAYTDFYPRGIEPDSPNVTALLNPATLKWRSLVTPGTPVPTPWEKADFDAMDRAYQKVREELNGKIAAAKRAGAPRAEVEKLQERSEELSTEHARKTDAYLSRSRFVGQVGAFEGAGYAAEGLYRPELDCIMFTKGVKPFCRVCQQAIERVIEHYGE